MRLLRPAPILGIVLIVLIILEYLFFKMHHPIFPWHHLPGLNAVIGLVSCIVVVLASKALGAAGLQRPEEPDDES